jgi:NhaP-type Na+/H+ or K+/H+ antiporter/CRP-like cAMP-binding protein
MDNILSFFMRIFEILYSEIGHYSSTLLAFASSNEEVGTAVSEHSSHTSMAPLLFIILSLFIGTATRYWLRKLSLPYTISLLLIGLTLGIAYRVGFFSTLWGLAEGSGMAIFGESINWAGHISPHVIFYIFLPTLIFEAAFAMHVHTFKKTFTNAMILALPGISVAIVLTAGFAMLLNIMNIGLGLWTWPVALTFGTIISATDPVAVVSILKEVGASKKLATLIEGESLLNDGTAIVIFMVFFSILTGTAGGNNALVEFIRVGFGGVAVGMIIGWIVVTWLKKVFNDVLFEITVVVGAAYLAFFVAEHFFHISGVLALVSYGIMMAGIGRTRISPQVAHFLHEFWELAAFIANTLIFLIVGVVIALRVSFTPRDFVVLILIYIAIIIVRAIVLAMFYPLMKRIGYGLTVKDGIIAWWGGLRGAIGLALSLMVASEVAIDPEIRTQILSLTAGIVFLTSLINATTIKFLINKLGLTKVGDARQQLLNQTMVMIRKGAEKEISKLKENRFMSGADWDVVATYLPDANEQAASTKEVDTVFETRKRMLIKEKESYWRQFSEGLLSPAAVQNLSDEIDHLLDFNGKESLAKRKDLEQMWQTPKMLAKLQTIPIMGNFWRKRFYRKLALSYDCARGFVVANEENLKSLSSLIIGLTSGSDQVTKEVEKISSLEDEINENRIMGLTFLRNLKDTYPEVYHAIETQIASRSLLNFQMANIQKLEKQGRLEPADASNLEGEIQSQMKQIIDSPPQIMTTEALRYLKTIPALSSLSDSDLEYFANLFQEKVFPTAGRIASEDNAADGFYIIIRGTVKVEKDSDLLTVLQPGCVIGAFETLTGRAHWASFTAESPVTALKFSLNHLSKKLQRKPILTRKIWLFAGFDLAERLLVKVQPWSIWRIKKLRTFINQGTIMTLKLNEEVEYDQRVVLLTKGEVTENEAKVVSAPSLIMGGKLKANINSTVFVLPLSEKAD